MATVTGFESLTTPTKSELRQFAELFAPLFSASSPETRRQAVAALSQCPTVPPAVSLFIASQPISVAATFLTSSPCLSDDLLIMIARTQGLAHARAIVRREALSPRVIDALKDLRHEKRPDRPRAGEPSLDPAAPSPLADALAAAEDAAREKDLERQRREDTLRQTIKTLAHQLDRPDSDRLGLRTLTPMQEALLTRFARNRETGLFASTLADGLSSSRWLAERIMLDISGGQLAVTLTGLAMDAQDAAGVLTSLYPQLLMREGQRNRAERLLASLDPAECETRIEAWLRADGYTFPQTGSQTGTGTDTLEDARAASHAGATAPRPTAVRLASDQHGRQVLRQRRG